MLVQYSFLGRSHYYSMNQCNLALKNNPKEEILRGRCLFQWTRICQLNVPHFLTTPIPCPMTLDGNVYVLPLLMFYHI
jgi:hypothetical protein